MTLPRYANAVAAKEALFDLAGEQPPVHVPPALDAALGVVYESERDAVVSIAATPTRSLVELAAVASLLAELVEDDAWEELQPQLARRVADDLLRLAQPETRGHS